MTLGAVLGRPGAPNLEIRVVLCAFMTARVQFDQGGPKFVTARGVNGRRPLMANLHLATYTMYNFMCTCIYSICFLYMLQINKK